MTITTNKQLDVWILVLGDVGRSPRMQYHAISILANTEANVCMFGFVHDTEGLRPELHTALTAQRLQLKSLPDIVVLDYHNVAYTLMQQPTTSRSLTSTLDVHKDESLAVRIAAVLERWGVQGFDEVVTVSKGLQDWLRAQCATPATVLYDKAPSWFGPVSAETAHGLLMRLKPDILAPATTGFKSLPENFAAGCTLITSRRASDGTVQWRCLARPMLLVSSTSWTLDEDFDLLLGAAIKYDQICIDKPCLHLPPIVILITGKGPLKQHYLERMACMSMCHVAICTAWLDAADYAPLLACADLGVSLHASSSGLDLPMKVSDMLGSGIPVCAYDYGVAHEQLDAQANFFFQTSQDLATIWATLFEGCMLWGGGDEAPRHGMKWQCLSCRPKIELHKAGCNANKYQRESWEQQWELVMPDILQIRT